MPSTPEFRFEWARHAADLPTATTIRLHPRVGDPPASTSHMGGSIAWPANEPWPRCDEHNAPLVPVLLLLRADVPELPFPEGADVFQLLWCPRDHEDAGYAPRALARWRALASQPCAHRPEPGGDAKSDYVPRPCVLHPERVVVRPSAFELDSKRLRIEALEELVRDHAAYELERLGIPENTALYQYHLSVAPGTKALGFVRWIQDPDVPRCDCGAAMHHLVTIDSAEFDGAYQRWMPLDERHVWKQGYAARRAVQSAAGLMLGDMGAVFVFVCTTCPERPIKSVHQSS